MKHFIFTLAFIVVAISCFGENITKYNGVTYNGKVASVKVAVNKAIEKNNGVSIGEAITDKDLTVNYDDGRNYVLKFDKQGRLISEDFYIAGNRELYKYQDSLLIETRYMTYDTKPNGNEVILHSGRFAYSYDEKGNRKTTSHYDNYDRLFSRTIDTYDSHNNLISIKSINSDGSVDSETKYKYSYIGDSIVIKAEKNYENKDRTSTYLYNKLVKEVEQKDGYDDVKEYTYNNNGKISTYTRYESNSSNKTIHTYIYEDNGDSYKSIVKDETGKILGPHIEVIYDYDNDKKTETYYDKDDSIYYRSVTMISNGLYLEYMSEFRDFDEYKYDVSFDNHGNWTKMIEYKNTIPVLIKTRKITYYQ